MKKARSVFIGNQGATEEPKPRRRAHGIIPGIEHDQPSLPSRVAQKVREVVGDASDAAKEAVIDLQEVASGVFASHPIVKISGAIVRLDRTSQHIISDVADPAQRAALLGNSHAICGYCHVALSGPDPHASRCPEARRSQEVGVGCSYCRRSDGLHDSDCNTLLKAFSLSEDDYEDVSYQPRLGRER